MESKTSGAFAIWVTGLPASGKSTLVSCLKTQLAAHGIDVAVLESDVLRALFTPNARYDEEEREAFYRGMVFVGELLTRHGVPVIFDATANRRRYRDHARKQIAWFIEVYVECSLEICIARDPKGIYRKAREGAADTVPGLQSAYEPPERPEFIVRGGRENADAAAHRIIADLAEKGLIPVTTGLK